ncbi:MAG: GNAT family N-acetyltransferase [Candidatus Zixiibacteriota bacterium]
MQIRKLKKDELDLAILPCVDPGFRKTLKQGMALRKEFLKKKMRKGLSVLVALKDLKDLSGEGKKEKIDYPGVGKVRVKDLSMKGKIIAGLIEYSPVEETNFPVRGKNLAFIDCIWVIPPFWQKGVAKNLMKNFLEKTRDQNFSGAAVIAYKKESWWGFFDYMPGWFFQKFGFRKVDRDGNSSMECPPSGGLERLRFGQIERDGNSILMFKNYKDAKPPKFILSKSKSTSKSGKTKARLFWSGQCPYSWWVKKLTEKEFSQTGNLEINYVNTDNRKTVEKFGITFGLTINGKIIYNRLPSWDEVKKALKSVSSV